LRIFAIGNNLDFS
jgi:hypothetical protein